MWYFLVQVFTHIGLKSVVIIDSFGILNWSNLHLVTLNLLFQILNSLGYLLCNFQVGVRLLFGRSRLELLEGILSKNVVLFDKFLDFFFLYNNFGHFVVIVRKFFIVVIIFWLLFGFNGINDILFLWFTLIVSTFFAFIVTITFRNQFGLLDCILFQDKRLNLGKLRT